MSSSSFSYLSYYNRDGDDAESRTVVGVGRAGDGDARVFVVFEWGRFKGMEREGEKEKEEEKKKKKKKKKYTKQQKPTNPIKKATNPKLCKALPPTSMLPRQTPMQMSPHYPTTP